MAPVVVHGDAAGSNIKPLGRPWPSGAQGMIYIFLPVHNRRRVTEAAARQLLAQTDNRFQLVLIDDGSTDGTTDAVRALMPECTVLQGTGSWWWAGSLQRGFDWLQGQPAADGDIVLIMNDDTFFEPDFLAIGRALLNNHPRSLLVAQMYHQVSGHLLDAGRRIDWATLKFSPVAEGELSDCVSTRGLFFRRADLRGLGGFHARLLPHYLSDYEFTMRARRRGFALLTHPSLKLEVDEPPTSTRMIRARSLSGYLRRALSPRSPMNPVYWSSFVLLASPRRYVPVNLWRVWRGFLAELRHARRGLASGQ